MKRLFVVGAPRSGTTWTMLLLAQHPAVAACQQAGFFHSLKSLEDWWRKGSQYGKNIVTVSGSDGARAPDAPDYARTELKDLLSMQEFYQLSRPLAENVFDKIAGSRPETKVVVEQTPENIKQADLILNVLPDACFLHVIRDPRSVFCSLRSAASAWSNGFQTSPIDTAKFWCSVMDKAQDLARLGFRYREVRYEALLGSGPQELRQIFDWLDLPVDASFCTRAVERCAIDQLRKSFLAPPSFFRRGEADGWRREASPSEIGCIEYIAGSHMRRLGYECVSAPGGARPLRLQLRDLVGPSLTWALRGPLRIPLERIQRAIRALPRS